MGAYFILMYHRVLLPGATLLLRLVICRQLPLVFSFSQFGLQLLGMGDPNLTALYLNEPFGLQAGQVP